MNKALAKAKRQPDPRHAALKAVLVKYWAAENPDMPELPWGPAEAGALGTFLRSNPTLDIERITQLLRNRLRSDDHATGEPVFVWIKYITRYKDGPLDKYKQPKEKPDGRNLPNRADKQLQLASSSTSAALARLQRDAGDRDPEPGRGDS